MSCDHRELDVEFYVLSFRAIFDMYRSLLVTCENWYPVTLQNKIYDKMISTDQAGDLAGRLLWPLAKGLFVRAERITYFLPVHPNQTGE